MTKKGIRGSTLKIIAITAMFIDHTAWCLVDRMLLKAGVKIHNIYSPLSQISVSPFLCVLSPLMHIVGRITFPIMLFLLVEGAKHTHNKIKYLRNMLIFALISEIPFNLAFSGRLYAPAGYFSFLEGQNVYVTLALALGAIFCAQFFFSKESFTESERVLSFVGIVFFSVCASFFCVEHLYKFFGQKPNEILKYILSALTFIALTLVLRNKEAVLRRKIGLTLLVTTLFSLVSYLLSSDYSFMGVTAAVIMWVSRENKTVSALSGGAYLTLNTLSEAGAFLAVPLIGAYNGQRGRKMKYFFYIFYPAHLLALWLIRILVL